MPFVRGFLRVVRRGRPGQPLPPGEEPTDPDYGIDEGEGGGEGEGPDRPPFEKPLPTPPPGIWPPPTPEFPVQPLPPSGPNWPPGIVWPPINRPRPPGGSPSPQPPMVSNKLWVLAYMRGYGFKYICIDTALNPPLPEWPQEPPIPPREPK